MIRFEHSIEVRQKYPRHYTGCFGQVMLESVEGIAEATAKLLEECRQLKREYGETVPEQISQEIQEALSSGWGQTVSYFLAGSENE